MSAFIILMAARRAARHQLLTDLGFVTKVRFTNGYTTFKWIPREISEKKYWFFSKSKKLSEADGKGNLLTFKIDESVKYTSTYKLAEMNQIMEDLDYVLVEKTTIEPIPREVLVYEKTGAVLENYSSTEEELRSFKKAQDELYNNRNIK